MPVKKNEMPRSFLVFLIVLLILVLWFLGAPPRWWLNLTKAVDLSDPVATGADLVEKYECQRCHRLNGQGALKGPVLDGVTGWLDSVSLRLWLQNPKKIKSNTAMPNFKLSDSEIEAIIAYLEALNP